MSRSRVATSLPLLVLVLVVTVGGGLARPSSKADLLHAFLSKWLSPKTLPKWSQPKFQPPLLTPRSPGVHSSLNFGDLRASAGGFSSGGQGLSAAIGGRTFIGGLAQTLTTERHGSPIGCRDQDGNLVDWYALNKLPKLRDAGTPFVGDGEGFMHFSSASVGEQWAMSDVSINDPSSAPGRTLAPVYSGPTRDSLILAFYNDAPPNDNTPSPGHGHTKGVVAFNEESNSGFWLVHSVPQYPPPPGQQYSYSSNGLRFGQSFFCMTLSTAQLETVANQLHHNCPRLYATQMSAPQKVSYPRMSTVLEGHCIHGVGSTVSVETLRPSLFGPQFTSFAKTSEFGADLYKDLVAPNLHTGLFTETWRLGAGTRLPSHCSGPFWVRNVQSVRATAVLTSNVQSVLTTSSPMTFEFRSSKDHSKWAVSDNENQPWVCIGDINRMLSQAGRGGGTVCHWNAKLWKIYRQMVGEIEPCPSYFNAEL